VQPSRWACPQCQWSGHPSFELDTSGKLVAQCGRSGCGFVDVSTTPRDLNVGHAVDSTGTETVVATSEPTRVAVSTPPVTPRALATTPRADLFDSTSNVLDAACARLAAIDAEVARLEELRDEGKALARMISAAKRGPRRARTPISPHAVKPDPAHPH